MTSARSISSERRDLLGRLQAMIGMTFDNLELLDEALTHSSYVFDHKELRDYERLEFFGDAVLKFVVSEFLFEQYPHYDEGKLTEIRAVLINSVTLEEVSRVFTLENYMLISRGISVRPSMLAQSMEAILGAIYLDKGLEGAGKFIREHFCVRADMVDRDKIKNNYKAKLQQFTQARAQGVPQYEVTQIDGPPHDPTFTVAVSVEKRRLAQGIGRSKKTAEQEAAKLAFTDLVPPDDTPHADGE